MTDSPLTLFSSDSRPRYRDDILAVLAAPTGTRHRFRYEDRYLPEALRYKIDQSGSARPVDVSEALVCFRSVASAACPEIIVPVRKVAIRTIERISDFLIFDFEVRDYPKIIGHLTSLDELASATATELDKLAKASERVLPVHDRWISMADSSRTVEAAEGWIEIVRLLSLHPTFRTSRFIRVEGVTLRDPARSPVRMADGCYEVTQGQYNISFSYYSGSLDDPSTVLRFIGDEASLRWLTPVSIRLDTRYDQERIGFEVLPAKGVVETDIALDVEGSGTHVATPHLKVPLRIRPSRRDALTRFCLGAAGATFVAAPGIIGQDLPTGWRLALAGTGAVMLGLLPLMSRSS